MLQAHRVVITNDDTVSFTRVCGLLFKSKRTNIINESLALVEVQPKTSLDVFRLTVLELIAWHTQERIDENYQALMKAPVAQWLGMLKDWQLDEVSGLKQNEPINNYIEEMTEKIWAVPVRQKTQLLKGTPSSMQQVFADLGPRPDNLQYAVAAFAMTGINKHQRQLWSLPDGTGKSRIMACAGLYALLEAEVPAIHFVFHTKLLMGRDKRNFGRYWLVTGNVNNVYFHDALDRPRRRPLC